MRTRQLRAALRGLRRGGRLAAGRGHRRGRRGPVRGRRPRPARRAAVLLPPARGRLRRPARGRAGRAAVVPARRPPARGLRRPGAPTCASAASRRPARRAPRADAALRAFLGRVFGEATEFVVHEGRLEPRSRARGGAARRPRARRSSSRRSLGLAVDVATSCRSATACARARRRARATLPTRRAGRRAPRSRTSSPSCAGRPRPATRRPWRTPACAWGAC